MTSLRYFYKTITNQTSTMEVSGKKSDNECYSKHDAYFIDIKFLSLALHHSNARSYVW